MVDLGQKKVDSFPPFFILYLPLRFISVNLDIGSITA